MESPQGDAAALRSIAPDPDWAKMTPEQKDKFRDEWRREDREKTQTAIEAQNLAALTASWETICPEIYRDEVDIDRVQGNRDLARMIMGWKFQATGMVIIGPTGHGKSRTAWHALRRAHFDGRKIAAMDGIKFANEAGAAAYSTENTEKWMNRLTWPDILFIDDLAKRFTKTSGQLLFGLIERRTSSKKPIIITTNLTSLQLETLIDDPELAKPLVRRLKEFCNPIVL